MNQQLDNPTTYEKSLPNGYVVQVFIYPSRHGTGGWMRVYRINEDGSSRETQLINMGVYTREYLMQLFRNKCALLSSV